MCYLSRKSCRNLCYFCSKPPPISTPTAPTVGGQSPLSPPSTFNKTGSDSGDTAGSVGTVGVGGTTAPTSRPPRSLSTTCRVCVKVRYYYNF